MSLEQLPEAILERIFSHVETPDILNLCWISKDFHRTATARLYQKVLLKEEIYDDVDWEAFEWATANYTVTWNVDKLTATLKKKGELAGLVKSLAVNISSCGRKPPLYDICVNLKEYHFTGQVYKALSFLNTAKVSCSVQCCPIFDHNLTELRLRFTENPAEVKLFKTVADMMIARGAHVNLKTLAFEHSHVDFYGASYNWQDLSLDDFETLTESPWIAFFMRVAASKYILNLKALCLQGMVTNSEKSIEFMRNAVSLEQLETLELCICEHSHGDDSHESDDDGLSTFLLCFAILVPKIKNLYVSHSSSCEICDWEDVRRALDHLERNSLEKLVLRLPPPSEKSVMKLHGTILEKQRNLIMLSYREEVAPPFDETGETGEPLYRFEMYNVCEQQHYYERLKQKYTPHFLLTEGGSMVTSRENENFLKNQGPILAKILESDIIYVTATEFMPKLTEYRKHGLCIQIKRNLLLVNGRRYNIAPFQSKKRREATRKAFRKYHDMHHSGESPFDIFLSELQNAVRL